MKILLDNKQLIELKIFHVLIALILVTLNIGIAYIVQHTGLFYVANSTHWLFSMGFFPSLIVMSLIMSALYFLRLSHFLTIISLVIVAGALSNFLEKFMLFGSVTDYIPAHMFGINLGFFNIADIQIWIGLVILNIGIFFGDKIKLFKEMQEFTAVDREE